MNLYVALDVSLEFTAVCVMDEEGELVLERKVASDPAAIAGLLFELPERPSCVGLEAGPLSEWLARGLAQADWMPCSWKRDTCGSTFGDGREDRPQRCPRNGAAAPHGMVPPRSS